MLAPAPCKERKERGTHVSLWEKKEQTVDKGGPPAVLIEVQLLETHDEIQIAVRGVKVGSDGVSEKLDAMHSAAAADAFQFLASFLN
jgi:hypothetical protein